MIPFHVPYRTGEELTNVQSAIAAGDFGVRGPFAALAKTLLQTLLDERGRVLLTHSCTGALELMALLCDFTEGDEVIMPSYTFSSTASAFIRAGARVVFADIRPETLSMDAESVASLLSPRTRAIVVVHYAGLPGDLEEVRRIAEAAGVLLLEDAAQTIGVRSDAGPLGSVGTMGAISFHHTKNVHCGFGGALVVREPVDFERAEHIWERGTNRSNYLRGSVDRYTWVEIGSSFSLDELHAAFLAAQLPNVARVTELREPIYNAYASGLQDLQSRGRVTLLSSGPEVLAWNYHAVVVTFASADEADRVRVWLSDNGIQAFIGYVPLHTSPVGQRLGYEPGSLPVTEAVVPRVLRLPIHTQMLAEDAWVVADQIATALNAGRG